MKRRAQGLTLIELMVTLAVAIVLLAIGIPAFNAITARDVSAATVNALVTALQQARVQAITTGTPIRVEAASGGWNQGWSVLEGVTGTTVLRSFPAPRRQVSITGGGTVVFVGAGEQYQPDANTPATDITFRVTAYKSTSQNSADCVRVTNVVIRAWGQVRSDQGVCP